MIPDPIVLYAVAGEWFRLFRLVGYAQHPNMARWLVLTSSWAS